MADRDGYDEFGASFGDGESEALDPRLAAGLAALPREMAPARDLWPGIAGRLPAAASAMPALPPALPAPALKAPALKAPPAISSFRRRHEFWRQAAAALVAAAAGAAITYFAMSGGAPAGPAAAPAGQGSQATAASYAAGQPGGAADPADYRLIEADYLRAKEALWVSVYARRDRFSPATLEAVEKNFAIIDQAIFDLRQALDRDKGNRRLEEELYRNHRRGLDLLRRLADTT